MPNINQLDEHVTNLIAAGEVVERAASVVKELVENSIDAHAENIAIHLVDSGVTEIRVIDDGDGMDTIDAKMCVMPHATSKIKDPNDLFAIGTLGFRGEALPSIVAVSNFRLITSQDGYHGLMYSLKGGVPTTEAVVSHPKGTEMIVKNLFFNTPARLQNLQSQSVELSYISDYVTKVSLAHPEISFLLTNNGKTVIQTNGNGELLEVIASIIGNEAAKNMIEVCDNNGTYRVEGYISNIAVTRSSKNYMYIFVNGRVVRSYNINNAILKGYDTLLMGGKFPVCILNIKADLSLVDVNVHPTKAEVRFSDEESLTALITNMIAEKLNKENLAVNMAFTEEETPKEEIPHINSDIPFSDNPFEDDEEEMEDEDNDEETDEDIPSEIAPLYDKDSNNDDITSFLNKQMENTGSKEDLFINSFKEEPAKPYVLKEDTPKVEPQEVKEDFVQQKYDLFDEKIVDENEKNEDKIGKLFYIGQLFGTYIIAQTDEELVLIDQHAAAERVNYEKILSELAKDENVGYDLLVPFNLEFSSSDCILINENIEEIKKLGIGIEEFGQNTYTIRRIPIWIFRGKEQEFVEEIISQIIHGRKSTKTEFLNNLAKSLACKKSIKGNEFHSAVEIEYLLDDLRKTKNPFTCPHGRPIIIKFDKYEIDKWFKRIV